MSRIDELNAKVLADAKKHNVELKDITATPEDPDNGYKAFYKGKEIEVYAPTAYAAQLKAAQLFGARKSYDVTVKLCERAGAQIIHIADY